MVATRGGTRVQYQEESGAEKQGTMEDVKQIVTRSRRSSGQSNADVSEAESTSSNPTTRITRSRQSLGHLENSPRILRSRQSTLMTEPIIESIEGELSDAESNCSSVSTRAKRKPPRHASRSVSSRSQKSVLISESISDHSDAESNCSSVSGVQCIATRSSKKTSMKCPSSPVLEYQQKEISDNESCSSGYTLQPIAKRLSRRKEGKLQSEEEKCTNETTTDSKEQMALKRQRPNLRELATSGDLTTVAQQNILSSPRRSSRNQLVSQRYKDEFGSISESQSKEISGKDECGNETSRDSQEHETVKKQMPYLRNLTVSEELSTVAQQILPSPRRSLRNQPVSQRDDKAVCSKESLSNDISDKVSSDIECVIIDSRDSSPEQGTLNKQKPSLDGVTVSEELCPGAKRNILSSCRSLRSHSVSQSDASVGDSQSKENLNKLSAVEYPEENSMPVREKEVDLPVEGKAASVMKLCFSQPAEKVLDQMIDLTVDEEQIQNTDDDENSVTKNKDVVLILDSNSETGDDERIEEDNEMVDEEVIEMEGDLEIEVEENNTPLVKKGHLQKASTQPFTDVVEDGLFVIDKAPGLDSSKKYYVDPNEGHLETEDEESENEDLSELDDDDFIDEDEDEELLNRPKRGFVLSTSIDTGINIKKMGGLYINFDAEKPNPGPSFLEKLKKESKKKDELLQKSIITPDFEKKESVPPYTESLNKLKKQRKEEREKTTGCGWFDMKAPEMTAELKNDLKALKMRSAMDPKHFYKKNDRDGFPKYFQVGTVVDNPIDYYHSRIPKKQRKRTIVEELLADSEFRRYNKKKYQEILAEKAARAEGKKKRKKKKFHT